MDTKAPWTLAEVDALNTFQRSGWHPYTCGAFDRMDDLHADYQALVGGDFGQLVATPTGWICPACGYTQNWATEGTLAIGKARLSPTDFTK